MLLRNCLKRKKKVFFTGFFSLYRGENPAKSRGEFRGNWIRPWQRYAHLLLLDAVLTIAFQVATVQVQEQVFHSEEG